MRIHLYLSLFVLASSAIAQAPAGSPPAAPVMHEVPLLSCSGLPCVEMTSGKVNVLRLVIDLASVHAYLELNAAQQHQLKLTPLTSEHGVPISDVQQTIVPDSKLGDLPMGDFPFMVLDLDADQKVGKKSGVRFPADGALAYGSFINRWIQLDWSKHVLRISDPLGKAPPCPRDCRDLKYQPSVPYGPLTLSMTGFEIDGNPVTAQIDTLFTGTMLLYPKAEKAIKLPSLGKSKQKQEFPFAQGGLELVGRSPADYTFDKDPVLQDATVFFWTSKDTLPPDAPFGAVVGTGLLSRGLFTFDLRSWKIWMETPAPQ